MKKILLAVTLGALAVASSANANWYAQGDLGYSKTKFTAYSSLDKNRFEPRISVGYDFGDLRIALDYTHHGKYSGQGLEAKIYGLGVSAFYDINTNLDFTPYVGVRLADNIFRITERHTNVFLSEKTENKFGYGVVVGASYPLNTNLFLNGNIEYNRLGSFDDTKIKNYGAKIGLRYDF